MINLGLDHDELSAFEAGLLDDHEIKIRSQILDLDHNVLASLTGFVLSGQVDIDVSQEVHRTAQITLLDPENSFGIDTDTPNNAGSMASRMLAIQYGVRSQQFPKWVWVPIICGPITYSSREDDIVSLSVHGKESLALDKCCRNITIPKGTAKTSAINQMLRAAGETRLDIPYRSDRLTTNHVVASTEAIWPRARSLARSLTGGFVLEYDGRGTAKLVDATSNTVWTFKGGEGGSLITDPKFTADTSEVKNIVVVRGGVPKGAKKRIEAVATASPNHPMSAQRLGRGGVPRYLREDIDDENITTKEAAQTLANNKLWELLQVGTDATFETLVIPHLEPYDYVRVVGEHYTYSTALTKFSIPLTTDGRMTVGKHWQGRRVNGYQPVRRKNPKIPRPKKAPAKPKNAPKRRSTTAKKARKK